MGGGKGSETGKGSENEGSNGGQDGRLGVVAGFAVAGLGSGRKKRACWRTIEVWMRLLKRRHTRCASRRSLIGSWARMSSKSSGICRT